MAEETARSKWRRYRPAMDFTRAKIILELNSSLKPEELDKEEVHKKFINQLAKSSLPNSKIDPRLLHEAYQVINKIHSKNEKLGPT